MNMIEIQGAYFLSPFPLLLNYQSKFVLANRRWVKNHRPLVTIIIMKASIRDVFIYLESNTSLFDNIIFDCNKYFLKTASIEAS